MLKTSVKFLCWFGAMLLIFFLVSIRRVITGVCAAGHLAYQARCVEYECGGTCQFSNLLNWPVKQLVELAQYARCPTAHKPVITHLRVTRPKISNIAPNQHKNFTEVFNIFNCFTIL
jgi:hypothetical protein